MDVDVDAESNASPPETNPAKPGGNKDNQGEKAQEVLVKSDSAEGHYSFSVRMLKELVKRGGKRNEREEEKKNKKNSLFPLEAAISGQQGLSSQAPARERQQPSIVEAGDRQGVSVVILSPLKPLVPGGWNRIIAGPCT